MTHVPAAMYSYGTTVSGVNVGTKPIASGTLFTVPAGTRHLHINIFYKTGGSLTIAGRQWGQHANNSEVELDLYIKSSNPILVLCSGTGTISIGWT